MFEPSAHNLHPQSDRGAAAPDSPAASVPTGGTGPPTLDRVATTVAHVLALLSELEHRIYLLEGRGNENDERNP